jgi:hypothetical protein
MLKDLGRPQSGVGMCEAARSLPQLILGGLDLIQVGLAKRAQWLCRVRLVGDHRFAVFLVNEYTSEQIDPGTDDRLLGPAVITPMLCAPFPRNQAGSGIARKASLKKWADDISKEESIDRSHIVRVTEVMADSLADLITSDASEREGGNAVGLCRPIV